MPKLIEVAGFNDKYLAILGGPSVEPSEAWKQLQLVRPKKGLRFYKAYPLNGGVVNVQKCRFTVIREATEEDRIAAQTFQMGQHTCNNPAAASINALFRI